MKRRNFLKNSAISIFPALSPLIPSISSAQTSHTPATSTIRFFGDGEMFEPGDYINELQKTHNTEKINKDQYGMGGAVEQLEKRMAELTGKDKAIFMPSGTMANQMAIAILSGENAKVFVQDLSHVYRDEADAAQTVFNKRLIPLAKNETFFTSQQLREAIESLPEQEVFQSGVGAVAIENPVRRASGRMVPYEEIQKISAYCKSKNIKLHLDGARLFIASGWSGISIKDYASHFDTVYISLYKYLGASGGAILCGDRSAIDKLPHMIKIHGGTMYGNWANAAMALHRLEGFEGRLKESIRRANEIFTALNKNPAIKITPLNGGTNMYNLSLSKEKDGKKLQESLNKIFNIKIPSLQENNQALLTVNETLLYQPAEYVIEAFNKSL